jgi:hypothetical protein
MENIIFESAQRLRARLARFVKDTICTASERLAQRDGCGME